jgi:hypothetical protein
MGHGHVTQITAEVAADAINVESVQVIEATTATAHAAATAHTATEEVTTKTAVLSTVTGVLAEGMTLEAQVVTGASRTCTLDVKAVVWWRVSTQDVATPAPLEDEIILGTMGSPWGAIFTRPIRVYRACRGIGTVAISTVHGQITDIRIERCQPIIRIGISHPSTTSGGRSAGTVRNGMPATVVICVVAAVCAAIRPQVLIFTPVG